MFELKVNDTKNGSSKVTVHVFSRVKVTSLESKKEQEVKKLIPG